MRMHSQVIGSGHPVVILHGLFGMSDNWLTIGKRLAERNFSVHLLDLRNHGRSPHADSHTFNDMCNDILSYLQQETLGNVSLVGHSMGGKTAMCLGLLHPEKIADLVVVDIAPVSYCCHEGSLHARIIDNLMQMDLSAYGSQTAIMAEMQNRLNDRGLTMFLAKNIKRQSGKKYIWKLNLPVLKKFLPALYAGLDELDFFAPSPTRALFIKGNLSDYITPQYEPDISRYFPDSTIVGIDNAGHWLHAQQPDRVIEIMMDFLVAGG